MELDTTDTWIFLLYNLAQKLHRNVRIAISLFKNIFVAMNEQICRTRSYHSTRNPPQQKRKIKQSCTLLSLLKISKSFHSFFSQSESPSLANPSPGFHGSYGGSWYEPLNFSFSNVSISKIHTTFLFGAPKVPKVPPLLFKVMRNIFRIFFCNFNISIFHIFKKNSQLRFECRPPPPPPAWFVKRDQLFQRECLLSKVQFWALSIPACRPSGPIHTRAHSTGVPTWGQGTSYLYSTRRP